MTKKTWRIENEDVEVTKRVARSLAHVFESLRHKDEVWTICLEADQNTGKTTFNRAFTYAVFMGDRAANGLDSEHCKTDNILSRETTRQLRLGDTREKREYREDRKPLFGGYDLLENATGQNTQAQINMFRMGKRWMEISVEEKIWKDAAFQEAMEAFNARETKPSFV